MIKLNGKYRCFESIIANGIKKLTIIIEKMMYYRNLQQAERLMKQGVDESYAPGVRLDEWEDDGSDEFDSLFKRLQKSDWPVWDAS